jgi:hypothetical protein
MDLLANAMDLLASAFSLLLTVSGGSLKSSPV